MEPLALVYLVLSLVGTGLAIYVISFVFISAVFLFMLGLVKLADNAVIALPVAIILGCIPGGIYAWGIVWLVYLWKVTINLF
jgi:hypothetical protein